VTKDSDQATADKTVNNDRSPTVAGLQAVFLNDGTNGANRWVVQLANVHAESHYGVFPLSTARDGSGGGGHPPTTRATATPPAVIETPAESPRGVVDYSVPMSSVRPATAKLPAPDRPIVERLFRAPGQAIRSAIELLIQNPRAFGLLFALWTLLGSPLYLGLRRRARMLALAV
jgi:hypothetical protein